MQNRPFSRDFKVSAVQLVQQQGYSIRDASKSLGIHPATLRGWVRTFGTTSTTASPELTGEAGTRAEIRKLREENRRLRMEREILKKATAFFAGQLP